MIKTAIKWIGILSAVELMLFGIMIATSMTDEEISFIPGLIYWVFKNVLSLPVSLLKEEYPFFLDSKRFPPYGLLLIIVNNSLIVVILGAIRNRKVRKRQEE
jgi:hypothetical protein